MLETVVHDCRYALRTLRKSPAFALTSIAVLALAIGANTAMFSVLNAMLLRPLPYPAPEQLTMLWTELPGQNLREGRSAFGDVEEWRRQSHSFSRMAAFDPASVTLTTAEGAEQIGVARVEPGFFSTLGVQPLHGRTFTAEEAAGRQRLILISHRFWQTRFGGSNDAIGSSIQLNGISTTVIGILPADFQFPQLTADLWEPHTSSPDWETQRSARGSGSWFVLARLRPDVTIGQAQAEMDAIARRLDRRWGISVTPLTLQVAGSRTRLALWMLTGAVFLVLLVAATNVAGLALARGASRQTEIAVRTALGASRGRIVSQLLVESLTLSVISGLLGLLVADACLRVILAAKPAELTRLDRINLDPQVLVCVMGLCLFTGMLVGLAPALTMARRNLQRGTRGIAGGMAARRIRRGLVVAEFALAVVLLVGSGLLIRSLSSVENVDPGFRPSGVLSLQLSSPAFPGAEQRTDFYRRILEQVESLPGVQSAGIIGDLFIGGNPERELTAEGDARLLSERLRLRVDEASEGFFRTLQTPLRAGRFFTAGDGPDSARVAIVNDAMARRLWPAGNPIGRRFKFGAPEAAGPWMTVVGVTGDMHRQGLETEPIPQVFVPLAQDPSRLATLLVRTSLDPSRMAGEIRAAVHLVDKHAPVYGVTTLDDRLGAYLTARRFQTSLLIGFSMAGLLIAAIGIYGLIQYSIATRTREIGIRIAVGARSGDIFRMVIREGLVLSLLGLAIGVAGALWLGRAGSSLLFGIRATDPLTFLSVSGLLTVVAFAACCFPARRAMKIEPIAALRLE